ncbi:HXXEE domain-containing protein [Actinoplanes sp. NPDC020271]|uniref:HXXEE domain-containing protein n=1 Tax=Actinoplanes sp. NPDC020271 TaxID=3363896 RepID=UPI0037BAEF62
MAPMNKIAAGLFLTWALSDLEELWTMSRSSRYVLPRLPAVLPIPQRLRRDGVSQRHVSASIAMMGLLIGAASVEGARTQGRSPFFRGVLLAYGLHGFGHLGMVAVARRYVSGALTAPVIVIPYWLWARRELTRQGVAEVDVAAVAVAVAGPVMLMGVHALMYRLMHD